MNDEQNDSQKKINAFPTKKYLPFIIITAIVLGLILIMLVFNRSKTPFKTNVNAKMELPPACTTIGQTWISPIDNMTLVCVPAGEFIMGAANDDKVATENEKPSHKVYLDAYWIDRTPVTNAMFGKFVKERQYKTWAEKRHSSYVYSEDENVVWEDLKGADWTHPWGPNSNIIENQQHPVIHVQYVDANAYCEWANRSLPTEAEWEKAARGTDERKYPWGNSDVTGKLTNLADRNLPHVAWTNKEIDDGYKYTSPVGSYPDGESPYGVLDMAGNVWNLVHDWMDISYYKHSPENNPQGPPTIGEKQISVIRGSSWYGSAWEARSVHRVQPDPNKSSVVVGFRCGVSASSDTAP
ncbi:MAG: SUMF1/EgtB/PvdO family nonheme iron enzyme [Chloroflexota bacterium]